MLLFCSFILQSLKQMQVIDENGNSIPKESSKRVVAGI